MTDDKDNEKNEEASGRKESLTAENKKKIIELYKAGDPQLTIAKKLGCSNETIFWVFKFRLTFERGIYIHFKNWPLILHFY